MNPPFEQTIVPFDDAAARLLDHADRLLTDAQRVVLAISGPVGAGKTLLADQLSSCIVSTDAFLPDYDKVEFAQRDLPEHADLEGLAHVLSSLLAGQETQVPVWSFKTHRREGYEAIEPARIIVCEGIHALHETVRPQTDISIFVEASAQTRWERWEQLELTGQRGWGVDKARDHFENVAEPTYARFSQEYRSRAAFIVVND